MKALKTITFALTATLFSSVNTWAAQSDIDAVERAFYGNQVDELVQLEKSTQNYDHFLASYRLGLKFSLEQKVEQAKTMMAKLIEEMEIHIQLNPKDAESLALLANIYGYSIGLNPSAATSYGPLAHTTIARAITLDKHNPRVQMFQGILSYNTPAMFGGSKEKAKTAFTLALEYFPSDINSGKHWGHSEASTWLGLTYLEMGDKTMALHYWENAIEINPNNGWAHYLLESHHANAK